MPEHTVGTSDSTSALALKKGFYWKTIWEHGENSDLRQKRPDPNVLLPGDKIFIPEKQEKTGVTKGTEAEHKFVRKGEPTKIKIKFLELGQPRKDEKYIFKYGAKLIEGVTNGEGVVEQFVPGDISSVEISFKDGSEVHTFKCGSLNPLEVLSGVTQRLNNLGFKCGNESLPITTLAKDAFEAGKLSKKTIDAVKKFQADNELEMTGKLDSKTLDLLKKIK